MARNKIKCILTVKTFLPWNVLSEFHSFSLKLVRFLRTPFPQISDPFSTARHIRVHTIDEFFVPCGGSTSLISAAATGQTDVVQFMLTEKHVHPDAQLQNGVTSLHLAARLGLKDVVSLHRLHL